MTRTLSELWMRWSHVRRASDDGVGGDGGADITTTVLESEQSVELVFSGL